MSSLLSPLVCQYSNDNRVIYTVNDGLPSATCYDITQDQCGFIWIASEGGLVKYDGQNFRTFTKKNGLEDNEIIRLSLDSLDRLWLHSVGRLTYHYRDSIYSIGHNIQNGISGNFHSYLANDGELYIGNNKNVSIFDIETLAIQDFTDIPPDVLLLGGYQDTVYFFNYDTIIKWSDNKIVDQFKIENMLLKPYFYYHQKYYFEWPILYYGSEKIITGYDVTTQKSHEIFVAENLITHIKKVESELWVLTQKDLSKVEIENLNSEKILDFDFIASKFHIDKNNNLWIASYKGGVAKYFPEIVSIQQLDLANHASNQIETVLKVNDKLILGTLTSEIVQVVQQEIKAKYLGYDDAEHANRIVDIIHLEKDAYLIASDRRLIYKNGDLYKTLCRGPFKKLFFDGETILINLPHGVFGLTLSELLSFCESERLYEDFISHFDRISEGRTYASFIDKDGVIWTGGVTAGLIKHGPTKKTYFKGISPIFTTTISGIDQLDNNVIGIATKGEGIIFVNGDKFFQVDESKGLTSNFCYNLDAHNNSFFIATNRGVSIIDIVDFDNEVYTIQTINRSNGLNTNEILDIQYYNDTLAIATNSGLSFLNLNEFDQYKVLPYKVSISGIRIDGVEEHATDTIQVSSDHNNIAIHYISPYFSATKKYQYKYRLVGSNDNWTYTYNNEINYTQLRPYEYTFEVGIVSDFQEMEPGPITKLHIEVLPLFMDTWLFGILQFLFLLTFLGTTIYLFVNRSQKKKLKRLIKEQTIVLEQKVEILKNTNLKLEASNKELEGFAYIASHDLQEPVNTIAAYGEIVKGRLNHMDPSLVPMMGFIISSARRMKNQIHEILEYSKIGEKREAETIDIGQLLDILFADMENIVTESKAIISIKKMPVIVGYRIELRSLFYNLVSNAIKYRSPDIAPHIIIAYSRKNKYHQFSVRDNGIGIVDSHKKEIFNIFQRLHNKDDYAGTGIGLAKCLKIVQLHEGHIWVESNLLRGSTFYFKLKAN